MEIESGTARKSEAGRRSKPLTERVFCVLLVCVACFSVSLSCIGQENQRVEEPLVGAASWVTADFPKTGGRDAQPTAAANPIVSVLGYIFPFSTKFDPEVLSHRAPAG